VLGPGRHAAAHQAARGLHGGPGGEGGAGAGCVAARGRGGDGGQSEKDAKLAQKLGRLQPLTAVFPQECVGQLGYFGPT
jgi:hypothetical protein